jgi:hypothetical protein
MLEAWYRFLGSTPLVLYYFTQKSIERPDPRYLAAVRKTFGQWLVESENTEFEQNVLGKDHDESHGYQSTEVNPTEGADALQRVILSYVLALLYPMTAKQREHQAWVKSVLQETFVLAASTARDDRREPADQSALAS